MASTSRSLTETDIQNILLETSNEEETYLGDALLDELDEVITDLRMKADVSEGSSEEEGLAESSLLSATSSLWLYLVFLMGYMEKVPEDRQLLRNMHGSLLIRWSWYLRPILPIHTYNVLRKTRHWSRWILNIVGINSLIILQSSNINGK